MSNDPLTRALRRFLEREVPRDGSVALMPNPMTYADLVACGLINRAVGTTHEATHAANVIADILARADEYDVAETED